MRPRDQSVKFARSYRLTPHGFRNKRLLRAGRMLNNTEMRCFLHVRHFCQRGVILRVNYMLDVVEMMIMLVPGKKCK